MRSNKYMLQQPDYYSYCMAVSTDGANQGLEQQPDYYSYCMPLPLPSSTIITETPHLFGPTFLKLDMNDFITTLEHEYYQPQPLGLQLTADCFETSNNQQHENEHMHSTLNTSSSAPPLPRYKYEWQQTMFNLTPCILHSEQTKFTQWNVQTQYNMHVAQHNMHGNQQTNSNGPCSPPGSTTTFSSSDVTTHAEWMKISGCTSKPKRIRKKRNYQRIFHTIPERNSCSEKKIGTWKFHLMDADKKHSEQLVEYKFHFYSGNNK